MEIYDEQNPPRSGVGKKIFNGLKKAGFEVVDLHYNPNNWGQSKEDGWGTWACRIRGNLITGEYFCGLTNAGEIYIEGTTAPFGVVILESIQVEDV